MFSYGTLYHWKTEHTHTSVQHQTVDGILWTVRVPKIHRRPPTLAPLPTREGFAVCFPSDGKTLGVCIATATLSRQRLCCVIQPLTRTDTGAEQCAGAGDVTDAHSVEGLRLCIRDSPLMEEHRAGVTKL